MAWDDWVLGASTFGTYNLAKAGYGAIKKGLGTVTGQSDYQPGLHELAPTNPDADNPAVADYNRRKAIYDAANKQFGDAIARGEQPTTPPELTGPPPAPPTPTEIAAGQIQGDRARILANSDKYGQLVAQLQDTAAGKGPSAALDTLREGNYRANSGAYGMAASAPVAAGQRAALFNNAINQASVNNQTTARDAAAMRANEMNAATGQLTTALSGAGEPLKTLYAGSQERDLANQNAAIEQDKAKQGISTENAKQAGETTRTVIQSVASTGQKAGGGG